jgi:predicted NBD/HSP70 family sugar kinase
MLQLIRSGRASTRADLVQLTGLARSTVAQRIDALIEHQLVQPSGERTSTGGRPPLTFAFNPGAGVVLAGDLGATHARLAVCDLGVHPLVEEPVELPIAAGPDEVMRQLEEHFDGLLSQAGVTRADVRGVGVGVPGPVEFATGRPVNPPIMPGWDGFPFASRLMDAFGAPALVDNDVNIMALGEHWTSWRHAENLLYVKVGTGIGCGIVASGHIHRGAQGAAGDIGHIRVAGFDEVVCSCGNHGCVEAVAGGGAVARQLRELGRDVVDTRGVVTLARSGDAEAVQLVRRSGRLLGEVLAGAVNLVNPAAIVIGGDLAHAHEQLFAGVREIVYQRSLPLATQHLRIVRSELDDRSGIVGAAVMAVEHVLAPEAVDAVIAG